MARYHWKNTACLGYAEYPFLARRALRAKQNNIKRGGKGNYEQFSRAFSFQTHKNLLNLKDGLIFII